MLRAPLIGLDVGTLPTPAASLGAGLGFRAGSWHATAVGRIFKDETLWAPALPEVGARVDRVAAELWACKAWVLGRIDAAPCLVLSIDRFTTRGVGPGVTPETQHPMAFALGGGVTAGLELFDWLSLVATAGLGIQISRPRIVIEGVGEVEQVGPIRIALGLAPEWKF